MKKEKRLNGEKKKYIPKKNCVFAHAHTVSRMEEKIPLYHRSPYPFPWNFAFLRTRKKSNDE